MITEISWHVVRSQAICHTANNKQKKFEMKIWESRSKITKQILTIKCETMNYCILCVCVCLGLYCVSTVYSKPFRAKTDRMPNCII